MTITVHLQPGETINQAFLRAVVLGGVQLAPDTHVVENSLLPRDRDLERRTTGIPFLDPGEQ
jgi:hypothetical protein